MKVILANALLVWVSGFAQAQAPAVPIAPGVNFVLAVSNAEAADKASVNDHILHGDYEMVVAISSVSAEGITQTAFFDGSDANGERWQGSIARAVLPADLAKSHLQIFGFHSSDPPVISGTTSLGPSLEVARELREKGATKFSFRNFASHQQTISGTLTRGAERTIRFPVLLNGKRVELDVIRAQGYMALGNVRRPFEMYILDHPRYPLSMRIAYGPQDEGFPFKADFAREIVRIDFAQPPSSIAAALEKDCRVEVPGIYFDFNEATLKPQSQPALKAIAAAVSANPKRAISVEGHTDNIGTDRYNADLSARRAAAVKNALVRDFKIDTGLLSTVGHGARKPIESNDTLAGRARNRRVELVCAGAR